MGAGINQGGDDDDLAESHDINVTPFIDVMLVLLIIFMVAAPLSTVDVPVSLPKSNAPVQPREDKPIYVTVQPDLTLSIGNDPVERVDLAARLLSATDNDPTTRLYLRADSAVPYGELMAVMNLMRAGGFTQVGLVGLEQLQ